MSAAAIRGAARRQAWDTDGNGMTNASFYDVLGRRAYIGLNIAF